MRHPVLTFARRHALALLVLAIALGPSSFALAQPSSQPLTRVCVKAKTGVLRAVGSPGRCAKGERSFLVNGRGVRGVRGFRGGTGVQGAKGLTGAAGLAGTVGGSGPRGATGVAGPAGAVGDPGADGTNGVAGAQGDPGPVGPAGPLQYAEFFALMPSDNTSTVAVGGAVQFPQDGPHQGTIVRSGAGSFVLPAIGTYRVAFSVTIMESGQLQLTLNTLPLAYSAFGRGTGASPIAGEALVTTTSASSVLSVVNPSTSGAPLTVSPSAGGSRPVTASLIIEQIG